jgi:hypothetical protein
VLLLPTSASAQCRFFAGHRFSRGKNGAAEQRSTKLREFSALPRARAPVIAGFSPPLAQPQNYLFALWNSLPRRVLAVASRKWRHLEATEAPMTRPMPLEPPEPGAIDGAVYLIFVLEILAVCAALAVFAGSIAALP